MVNPAVTSENSSTATARRPIHPRTRRYWGRRRRGEQVEEPEYGTGHEGTTTGRGRDPEGNVHRNHEEDQQPEKRHREQKPDLEPRRGFALIPADAADGGASGSGQQPDHEGCEQQSREINGEWPTPPGHGEQPPHHQEDHAAEPHERGLKSHEGPPLDAGEALRDEGGGRGHDAAHGQTEDQATHQDSVEGVEPEAGAAREREQHQRRRQHVAGSDPLHQPAHRDPRPPRSRSPATTAPVPPTGRSQAPAQRPVSSPAGRERSSPPPSPSWCSTAAGPLAPIRGSCGKPGRSWVEVVLRRGVGAGRRDARARHHRRCRGNRQPATGFRDPRRRLSFLLSLCTQSAGTEAC